MDLSTSIASMAMSMSQAKLQQDIGLSVLKKAMDTNAQAAQSIVDMMAPAKTFSGDIGAIFDARA